MARSLLSTLESIATPCSVNAKGKVLERDLLPAKHLSKQQLA